MKAGKHIILAAAVAGLPFLAQAQSAADHASRHAPAQANASAPASTATQADAEMSEGEVRKVDKDRQRITLRHGELKNLDMPPMTMVFRVADPAMLDMVQTGDKVRFVAEKVGSNYTITAIEK